MTYREAFDWAVQQLKMAGIEDASSDVTWLMEYACGIKHIDFVMHQIEEMPCWDEKHFTDVILRRKTREPVQQITGEQEFMGLPFRVTSDVLCPRQDTETLAEETLSILRANDRILDLCTGTGCILISVLSLSRVSGVKGTGIDISERALDVARYNAKKNRIQAEWIESDLFEKIEGLFDVIVSNPPYIPSSVCEELMPEVRDFEPRIALDGDTDGLAFYRRIIASAPQHLTAGGYLLFEIGYDQGEDVSHMMEAEHFREVKVVKDLSGNDRVVMGHL